MLRARITDRVAERSRSASRNAPIVFIGHFGHIDHEDDHVRFADRAGGRADHVLPQRILGRVNARRVDEDDLRGLAGENAQDAIARGLRLGRDDGNLLAQQRVQQRGLAHVRLADNGDKAGTEAGGSGLVQGLGSLEVSFIDEM